MGTPNLETLYRGGLLHGIRVTKDMTTKDMANAINCGAVSTISNTEIGRNPMSDKTRDKLVAIYPEEAATIDNPDLIKAQEFIGHLNSLPPEEAMAQLKAIEIFMRYSLGIR